jgi:hypothetical protein
VLRAPWRRVHRSSQLQSQSRPALDPIALDVWYMLLTVTLCSTQYLPFLRSVVVTQWRPSAVNEFLVMLMAAVHITPSAVKECFSRCIAFRRLKLG